MKPVPKSPDKKDKEHHQLKKRQHPTHSVVISKKGGNKIYSANATGPNDLKPI
jgi:hypothetical protein